jgi:hypothetical protein
MCEHGRERRFCKERCGGQALCVHLKNKYSCKAPAPAAEAAASGAGGSGAAAPRKRKREEAQAGGGGGRGVRESEPPQDGLAHARRGRRLLLLRVPKALTVSGDEAIAPAGRRISIYGHVLRG